MLWSFLRKRFPSLSNIPPQRIAEEEHPQRRKRNNVTLERKDQRPRLFEYQRDLADGALGLLEARGRALLSLPTGAGKTRTAVAAILDALSGNMVSRVIWLAPSIELLDQAWDTFVDCWNAHGSCPDLRLSRVLGSNGPSITFLTPQAVFSASRSGRDLGAFQMVVFDEAHQLGARTFIASVDALVAASLRDEGKEPALLGLSATPGRGDDELETEALVRFFNHNLLVSSKLGINPVLSLQKSGVLSKLEFEPLSPMAVTGEGRRLLVAIDKCRELAADGSHTLVFSGSVGGAMVLAEVLQMEGISSECVHSGLEDSARRRILADFGAGKIRVLTNQRLLATCYDCPAISDVLILSQVTSPTLFEQIVGRAARGPVTGGWESARIWQFDDHLKLHGLPQSYYRYQMYDWR